MKTDDPAQQSNPFAQKRELMVQSQLWERGIYDQRVLDAMRRVPRHKFVLLEYETQAYEDHPVPIGEGQTISQPFIIAVSLQALALQRTECVLEVGTGSGYQAAVVSRLVREVVSIERYRTLADAARERLKTLGYGNVTILAGDGFSGAPERAPFDRIIVTAAAEEIPNALVEQLAEGGKLVLPLGPRHGAQYIVKLTKAADGTLSREDLIAVRFVPLLHGQAREL